jgi:hypothetical protein
MEKGGSMRKKSKLTQIDFCVKDLLTPASLRSEGSGRFQSEQAAALERNNWPNSAE